MKITAEMVDAVARAIYREAGWDRKWRDISKSGRHRWRAIARLAVETALRHKDYPKYRRKTEAEKTADYIAFQ